MSNGPIEFASDGPVDDKGPTEFGGRAGLIQGGVAAGEVHEVSASEGRGMIARAVPFVKVDPLTGFMVDDGDKPAIDPATGMLVDDKWNMDGSAVAPVEAPPKTAPPSAGVF